MLCSWCLLSCGNCGGFLSCCCFAVAIMVEEEFTLSFFFADMVDVVAVVGVIVAFGCRICCRGDFVADVLVEVVVVVVVGVVETVVVAFVLMLVEMAAVVIVAVIAVSSVAIVMVVAQVVAVASVAVVVVVVEGGRCWGSLREC